MNETTTKQPLKKRSLSSYLSNVSTRREELEKISKQETSEEEDTAGKHEQRETLSEEVSDKFQKMLHRFAHRLQAFIKPPKIT